MKKTYAEEIIKLINEAKHANATEENNINKGYAMICYEKVDFSRRMLLDDTIDLLIPNDWFIMDEELAVLKYPSVDRPKLILSDKDSATNLTFTLTDTIIEEDEPETFKDEILEEIKEQFPSSRIYDNEALETEEGKKIAFFSFDIFLSDKRLLYCIFFMSIKTRLTVGSFHCDFNQKKDWRTIFKQMLLSLREIDSHVLG